MFTAKHAVIAMWIHQCDGWPALQWDGAGLSRRLAAVRHRQGLLVGRMAALGLDLRAEAQLQTLSEDVVKSSAIEGEVLDSGQVRSSIARRLGMDIAGLVPADRDVEGVVEMMLDATQRFSAPLDTERLFAWHAALFPTGRSGMARIVSGAWRTDASGPMQVVSGPVGRERVHFRAPDAGRIDAEMQMFLAWFEDASLNIDPVVRAAIAHLWFVTIHPFEDGNGRIARAIADLALARADGSPQRFYGMSAQIRRERQAYYDILEATQKGGLDATAWLAWFLVCLERALEASEEGLAAVLQKARFWARHAQHGFNERQRKLLDRLLDGFEGRLTTSKWAAIAKCSQDTALRDIGDLLGRGVLARDGGGGRSARYALAAISVAQPAAAP